MFDPVLNMFRIPELRRKVLFTLGLLVAYRFGFHVVIPGVDLTALADFEEKTGGGVLGGILVFMTLIKTI